MEIQFTRSIYKLLLKHFIELFVLVLFVLNMSLYFTGKNSLKKEVQAQFAYTALFQDLNKTLAEVPSLSEHILAIRILDDKGYSLATRRYKKSWQSRETSFPFQDKSIAITHRSVLSANIGVWFLINSALIVVFVIVMLLGHYGIYKHWRYLVQLELWAGRYSRNPKFKFYLKTKDYKLINAIRQLNKDRLEAKKGSQKADHYIRSQTFLDSSTSLGNRLYFEHRLESVLQQDDRVYGAVMLINYAALEEIKAQGNNNEMKELLLQFADILKVYVDDTAQSILSRVSATEFALLLPLADGNEIEKIALNILRMSQKIRLPEYVDQNSVCHIGVDMYDQENTSFQIMAEADMALRAAQLHGPSGWFMYDTGELPPSEIKGSVRWRTTIENALNRNLFNLNYQPVIDNKFYIHHHEVLVRMEDGKGEFISAKVFLPMAKKCGLIPEIDKKMLMLVNESIQQHGNSPISVNIHIDSWLNREFCNWLLKFLRENSQLSHLLIFEISEYELAKNAEKLTSIFAAIRRFKVKLMVDQVGLYVLETTYLDHVQLEYLKLHQSIVHRIHEIPENQMFIRSLQSVVAEKKLSVFAMGVESGSEISTLKRMGVDGLQGHYIKRPVAQALVANKEVEIDGDNLDL